MINWFDVPSESPNKDLTLKNLKVSENGTYGESGVAYSSVEVDVNGGGGGSSDFKVVLQTLEIPETVFVGEEDDGYYLKEITVGQATFEYPIYYDDDHYYIIFMTDGDAVSTQDRLPLTTIDDVDIELSLTENDYIVAASSESPFTVTLPQTTIVIYKASDDCINAFATFPLITAK